MGGEGSTAERCGPGHLEPRLGPGGRRRDAADPLDHRPDRAAVRLLEGLERRAMGVVAPALHAGRVARADPPERHADHASRPGRPVDPPPAAQAAGSRVQERRGDRLLRPGHPARRTARAAQARARGRRHRRPADLARPRLIRERKEHLDMNPNRVVAVLTPLVFAPAAGWIASWAARNMPGLPKLDPTQVTAVFIAGATIAFGKAALWLHGWQQFMQTDDGR